MIPVALGFTAGCAGWFLQASVPPTWVAALAAATGVALFLLFWLPVGRRLPPVGRGLLVALAAAALGFGWTHRAACVQLCNPFPDDLIRADLVAVGRVAGLPEPGPPTTRFLLQIESLIWQDKPLPWRGRVRLTWPRDAAAPPRAGERWQLRVRLRPPHGFVNPGGFDFEGWLFQQGVQATGYVRDPGLRLDASPGPYRLARLREGLRERLLTAMAPDAAPGSGPTVGAALLLALVIGDDAGLTPAQWEVMARTGTSHLVSISGLHVGLAAGFVFFAVRRLWARVGRLALGFAAPRAAALAALIAALGYSALAGFAVPTQRALVMLAVVLLALALGRAVRPAAGLALALLAVLALHPLAVLSYGFWLSFGAVAVLFYALGRRLGPAGPLWRWGAAQWAVGLGLLPLLLWLFGRASVVAPLVNLLAVPLFGLLLPVLLGATLLTVVSGWAWPVALSATGLGWCYAGLAWVAEWPWAATGLSARPAWVWLAAFAGVALWLAPRGLPGRAVGLLLLLPLLTQRPPAPAPGTLAVTLLDVGQGLSVLLRTARHSLVYDTGPVFPTGFNTGAAVVAPTLRHLGIGHPDLLLVSHADQDHAGGVAGLLATVPVGRVLTGEPAALAPVVAAARPGTPVVPCRAGQGWTWDGVDFTVVHPPADGDFTGNNASCVLRVRVGRRALLLPGDIEAAVERALVADVGAGLASDILVAAHHGSATSTTAELLATVQPALVLYTAGFANRYAFPAAVVRERVAAHGIPSLNTGDSGAIGLLLRPDGRVGGPWQARWQQRRPWRHLPGDRSGNH